MITIETFLQNHQFFFQTKGHILLMKTTDTMRILTPPLLMDQVPKPIFEFYGNVKKHILKGRFPLYGIHFTTIFLD